MHPTPHDEIRVASFADLDTTILYALLKLRGDVFVVEQACAYADLDGRDTEPGTRHVWLARDRDVLAYLRILADADTDTDTNANAAVDGDSHSHRVERIGRVVVAATERGAGHAARLMRHALTVVGNRDCVLEAQAHLAGFYRRLGFEVTGDEYIEDGIPHVPMRRPAPDPLRGRSAHDKPAHDKPAHDKPAHGRKLTATQPTAER